MAVAEQLTWDLSATAAEVLKRRLDRRARYRRKRDRKIAVDWLGHTFMWSEVFQITGYDPANHTLRICYVRDGRSDSMSTDKFWWLVRRKLIAHC